MSNRMESAIVVAAIDSAMARRGDKVAGCVLHSDRGSQFRSRKAQQALFRHRMLGSMGQVGSAGDNAAMESFFSLLQKNVLNRQPWQTREQLRIAIGTWIERTYHRRRRQAEHRSDRGHLCAAFGEHLPTALAGIERAGPLKALPDKGGSYARPARKGPGNRR